MAISQETKTVVKKTTYVCDMLFEEVEKDEVYKVYHNHCVSKEAVRRLPKCIAENSTLLKYTLYGSGQEHEGFQPEWLHKGVWVLEVPTYDYGYIAKLTNNNDPGDSYYSPRKYAKDDDPARFLTYEDAQRWINAQCDKREDAGFRYWVFVDGELINTFKTRVIAAQMPEAMDD